MAIGEAQCIQSYPPELLIRIFSQTDIYTARNLAQTCRLFLLLDEQDDVWRIFAKQLGLGDRLLFVEDTSFKSMVKRHYVVEFEKTIQIYPKNLFKFLHPELLFRIPSYSDREDENDSLLKAQEALHSKYPIIRDSRQASISIEHDRLRKIKHLMSYKEKPTFPAQSPSSTDMEQELPDHDNPVTFGKSPKVGYLAEEIFSFSISKDNETCEMIYGQIIYFPDFSLATANRLPHKMIFTDETAQALAQQIKDMVRF